MLAGIVGGAMQGGGAATVDLAGKGADYLAKSSLQEEAGKITALRDQVLSDLRKSELSYADELHRAPGKAAAEEIDRENAKPAYDAGGDTVRPKSPTERAATEEGALRRQGLISEAMDVRKTEQQRQQSAEGHQVQREQIASQDKYHNAVLKIQEAAEGRIEKGANLDNEIKTIAVANAKRVDTLRNEYANATPERKKAINEEIQTLTGKDNDYYLPVPLKDDMGNVTGYRIFDRKGGKWVDDGAPSGAKPSQADIDGLKQRASNPQAVKFFEDKFGKGAAAQYLPKADDKPKPAAPAARATASPAGPGIVGAATARDDRTPQQRREDEMRTEYEADQEKRRKARKGSQKEFEDNIERTRLRSDM